MINEEPRKKVEQLLVDYFNEQFMAWQLTASTCRNVREEYVDKFMGLVSTFLWEEDRKRSK